MSFDSRSVSFIQGDLFESEDDLTDSSIWREVSEQPEVQEKSREKVLKIADYIVPGHGKMFHVSHAYKTAWIKQVDTVEICLKWLSFAPVWSSAIVVIKGTYYSKNLAK